MLHNDVTSETETLIYSYSSTNATLNPERMEGDRSFDSCSGQESMTTLTLEKRLEDWIYAECNEPKPQTPRRFRELNVIFRDIYLDPRFWRYQNQGNFDYYDEAISRMWRYFRRYLCQAPPEIKSGSFLETRTYAVGRLLTNLKGHLKNIQIDLGKSNGLLLQPKPDPDGMDINPVEMLPNPEPDLAVRQYEAFIQLLKKDPTGELTVEENTLRGREGAYTLTAQKYLLMRHEDEMTIQEIADTLGIPRGSVQGGAKPTKWKELERRLAQMAIDSVPD
jgi:hypothetical protein